MAENYVLLETVQLTATTSSVVFDNIPQTGYTDLVIRLSSRENSASIWNNLGIAFNGSGTYYAKSVVGTGGATTSQSSSALDRQYANGGSTTANTFGNGEIYIPNYAGSLPKVISSSTVGENNATTSVVGLMAGLFTSTSAITTITLTVSGQSFVTGSTFSLYGISASGISPTTAPKATGGNIIANDGTYWYHAFLNSGTFTPLAPLTCGYLVVAGGGGASRLGGAGAGGLRSTVTATGGGGSLESAISVSTATTVTIGAGGPGCVATGGDTSLRGQNGSNSVFGSITSLGGGGGGSGNNNVFSGGSGGGAWPGAGSGGAGTSGQGYAGGAAATNASPYGGGGGGGAGAVGQSQQSGNTAGTGGNGIQITAFATPTGTGADSGYYAGGGGGSSNSSVTTKAGGLGGGGAGGGLNPGNTNTGGGGGAQGGTSGRGGAGGSGIVIIRYPMA